MNIDGIKGAGSQAQGQKAEPKGASPETEQIKDSRQRAEPGGQGRDQVELSGTAEIGKATYTREALGVQGESAASARTEKLDAILERVKTGFYDSRTVYEHVADKLLAQWQIGSSRDAHEKDL